MEMDSTIKTRAITSKLIFKVKEFLLAHCKKKDGELVLNDDFY